MECAPTAAAPATQIVAPTASMRPRGESCCQRVRTSCFTSPKTLCDRSMTSTLHGLAPIHHSPDRAGPAGPARVHGMLAHMVIVHVHVRVKPGMEDAFIAASRANARASLGEPGVVRFDVVRQLADPSRFVLTEVFRDEEAPAAHKATPHYAAWRDAVEPMMAEPRVGTKYAPIEPEGADGWRHT